MERHSAVRITVRDTSVSYGMDERYRYRLTFRFGDFPEKLIGFFSFRKKKTLFKRRRPVARIIFFSRKITTFNDV